MKLYVNKLPEFNLMWAIIPKVERKQSVESQKEGKILTLMSPFISAIS